MSVYLVERGVCVSDRRGGATERRRGDLAAGALLSRLLRHRGQEGVTAASCHLTGQMSGAERNACTHTQG